MGGGVFSIISDLLTSANRGRPPPPPGFSWCHQQISSILLKRRPKRQKRVLNFHPLTLVKEWKFKTKKSRKMNEIINECQKNEKIAKKWPHIQISYCQMMGRDNIIHAELSSSRPSLPHSRTPKDHWWACGWDASASKAHAWMQFLLHLSFSVSAGPSLGNDIRLRGCIAWLLSFLRLTPSLWAERLGRKLTAQGSNEASLHYDWKTKTLDTFPGEGYLTRVLWSPRVTPHEIMGGSLGTVI